MLTIAAWQTLAVIAGCFGLLILTRWPADAVLVAGVAVLMFLGVLTPAQALAGMANEGMATVGVLFVVAEALTLTGVVSVIADLVLGRTRSIPLAQARLMGPVALFSSVLNNTPVVAMLVPAIADWAKRNNLSVSQLMIPLSYAAIIGGTCTLVGTSTNLVVNDMLTAASGQPMLSLFDLAWVGVPCTLAVIAFTVLTSRWLLPHRKPVEDVFADARQYILEMEVEVGSPLVGKSIEEAGLRQLPGMYLIEVQRRGNLISAVSPREILCAEDHLIFAGDVRAVVDLKKIRGLRLAENQAFKLGDRDSARCLVEVVVSPNFPHLGKTVRDARFRNQYNAAIIAVARNAQMIRGRIGDIVLRPGDTLLLETHEEFVDQHRYSREFLLVSRIEDSEPPRHDRAWHAGGILLAMVAVVGMGWASMLEAALLAAGAMLATRCIRVQEARRSVDWQVLLVIAASIGLGTALDVTGAADVLAHRMVGLGAGSAMTSLVMLFLITAFFSALISNVAAAVLVFPIAVALSGQLGVSLLPYAVVVMIGASTCFATPIGYQTNLMVYGPGNYRFVDFLRLGIPLSLVVGLVTLLIVPLVWPF